MKVKLLRKVRERYSISEVNKVSSSSKLRTLVDTGHNFALYDNERNHVIMCTTYDSAYNDLINLIRKDYMYYKKDIVRKTKKLWYNEKVR